MHGLGGIAGLLHQLAPAGVGGVLALVDHAGRQFPGEALQRRTVLPHDRNFSVRRQRDDGDVILLADRVIKLRAWLPGANSTSRSMISIHGEIFVVRRDLILGQSVIIQPL